MLSSTTTRSCTTRSSLLLLLLTRSSSSSSSRLASSSSLLSLSSSSSSSKSDVGESVGGGEGEESSFTSSNNVTTFVTTQNSTTSVSTSTGEDDEQGSSKLNDDSNTTTATTTTTTTTTAAPSAAAMIAARAAAAATIAATTAITTTAATTTSTPPQSTFRIPSWREMLELPIKSIQTQNDFDAIPRWKRLAIVARVSVLHLTLLSCGGPLIIRGALLAARGGAQKATTAITTTAVAQVHYPLTPWLACLFTVNGLSWHAVHNLLNDWQDLDDDDDDDDDNANNTVEKDGTATPFRLAYGCHALKQGYVTKRTFLLKYMLVAAIPAICCTLSFSVSHAAILAPAAPYGILALFFYTIVCKPLALGEVLIYCVWGPLMAGFG